MKRIIVAILAVVALIALAVPALAHDMYVANDSAKVYRDPDKHSKVISRLPAGGVVDVLDSYGNWYYIGYRNKHGEFKNGWMQGKNLSGAPVHKHKWSSWRVSRYPTCTEVGSKERYCTGCGKKQTKEIKKTGHDWGSWKVTQQGTCVDPGVKTRTCHNCGKKQNEQYYADHQFGEWTVLREPTCTEAGQREHTCVVCGYTEDRAIDKLPHDFQYKIIEEATDHSSGTRASVCQVCGYTEAAVSYDPEGTMRRKDRGDNVRQLQQLLADQGYLNAGGADGVYGGGTEKAVMQFQKDHDLNPDGVAWPQTMAMLQHDFGPWETVKALTRTEPGVRQRVCRDCGYVQRETIESGDVIERGARGESIRAMQQILKQLGYDAGGFDGIYGKKLDSAFGKFCADNGMEFEVGKVSPADVDALVNAWFAASQDALHGGSVDSPVNMALSVTAASDEGADENATTYTWTLTNLGGDKCMFTALLLTYGNRSDFSHDNLVMVLDGEELKSNAGNSVSGSFTVAKSWGDGNLNFAAMGIDEKTGEKWLSNTVVYESVAEGEPRTVEPVSVELNVTALPDGDYHAAFDRGDIASVTSGIFMNAVHIYTPDTYYAYDIESLAAGDTIVVEGEAVEVVNVQNADGTVMVNGGLDEGGVNFVRTEDGTAYQIQGYDDYTTYTERGVTTLMVDPSAQFVDDSDIDGGSVTAGYGDLVNAMQSSDDDSFTEDNTILTVKSGLVVEIHRIYVP